MDDEKNLDPFGREQGDDPLTEMGWTGSEGAPAPNPQVAPPEAPDHAARGVGHEDLPGTAHLPPTSPPPPRTDYRADYRVPQGLRPKRSFAAIGCLFPVIVLVFVVAVGAVIVTSVINAIDDGIDDVIPTVPTPGGDGGDGGDGPGPPQGLGKQSLFLRGNLSPALKKLQDVSESGQVRFMRLEAARADVQVALGANQSRLLQATYGGEVNIIATTPGGGGDTFPWSAINASAPRRIVTKATGGKPSRMNYMVLNDAIDLQWQVFLKSGAHYTASPDGLHVTRVSG